jgi:hypothetical protein
MKELDIKRALVQKLIAQGNIEAISAEFPFEFGRRRADLICAREGKIYAYEIKSKFDNTDRLAEQIKSYLKLFDFVSVVCDKKHLAKILNIIPPNVGVYISSEVGISSKREAKQIKNSDTIMTLDALPMGALRQTFKLSAKSKLELCEKIKTLFSKEIIRSEFRKHITKKHGTQTNIFKNEISNIVTLDDVLLLEFTCNNLKT